MVALVDTNVIVYRYDARFPDKQKTATRLILDGISADTLRLPHQAIVEFVAAVTRAAPGRPSILAVHEAHREAEELLLQFDVLYPNDDIVRLATRGTATYGLSWFDAHMWAYAEYYGIAAIYSEDFQDGRIYGTVRVINPFRR